MKATSLLIISSLFLVIACEKNDFETKPKITIKSVNKLVEQGQPFIVDIEFTDKEGDVSDSLFIVKQRLNKNDPKKERRIFDYKIPNFPNTSKGQITFSISYTDLNNIEDIRIPGTNPSRSEPDTLTFKFVVKDKGGNFSDTLILNDVFVKR